MLVGEEVKMTRDRWTMARMFAASLLCGGLPACVERQVGGETTGNVGSTGSEVGGTSSGVPTTGTTDAGATSGSSGTGTTGGIEPPPLPGTTGEPDDTCGFLCGTTGSVEPDCDLFTQNCPEGEKCAPYSADGGNWNARKCVPVMGDGQPGDPCMALVRGASGLDDCAKGAMCWEVDLEKLGHCVEVCSGSEEMPECKNDGLCAVSGNSVLAICLSPCDPLGQDCPGGDLCIFVGDSFMCVVDASGDEGQAFDPCEFANACDHGLVCLAPDSAAECDPNATGCCLPFCDLSDPAFVCPGVGQACVSLYEEGMAPETFKNVGTCAVPA